MTRNCMTFNCRPGFSHWDQNLGLNRRWASDDEDLFPWLEDNLDAAFDAGIREFKFQLPTGKYRWEVEQPFVMASRFPVGRLKNLEALFGKYRSQDADVTFTVRSGFWFSHYDDTTGDVISNRGSKAYWPINAQSETDEDFDRAMDYLAGLVEGLNPTFDAIDFDALCWLGWEKTSVVLEALNERLNFRYIGGELPGPYAFKNGSNEEWFDVVENFMPEKTRWSIKGIHRLNNRMHRNPRVWVFDNEKTDEIVRAGVNIDYWSGSYQDSIGDKLVDKSSRIINAKAVRISSARVNGSIRNVARKRL